ncbi:nifR3 family TIM-barrel protein [Elusimicrobium posterum]|uniref:tRNA dihydrouridine synthase DusB n=1 Tax=Elusimicrobium posterum TaxID=3116653 RepID=UPI003C75C2D0
MDTFKTKHMNPFAKPLKIGDFTAKNNLLLAPMAGITDTPFRIMCLENGAGVVCSEMVSARGAVYENEKSLRMLKVDSRERPVSIQIFGATPEDIFTAAKFAQQAGADIIDINAGCPVKKINKAGAGCVLIKQEKLLGDIVAAAVKAVKVPVTLKTRIGLTPSDFAGARLAKIAQDNGASALVMHARFACNMHNGPADLELLSKVVQACSIPVIGNGGIVDVNSANAMFETGVAGVMVGRGAIGNPKIFESIIQGKDIPYTAQESMKDYLSLIEANIKFYNEKNGIARSRKTVGFWLKGFPGASDMRSRLVRIDNIEEIRKLFNEYN